MKKWSSMLTLAILGAFILSNLVLAAPTTKATPKSDRTNSTYTQEELEQIREIHSEAVEQGAVSLNEEGTITVNTDSARLGVNKGIFKKYIKSVGNINDIVELGVAYFDENFDLKVASADETINIISERDKKLQQSGTPSTNRFDTQFIMPAAFPVLDAYAIADDNYQTISDYFDAIQVYAPWSAYPSTVGYWISKVQEGGSWDYKVKSGYTPYNKQWQTLTLYTSSVRTSEWFGNYNYGYTGRFLFSLNILHAGGDGVSYIFNHTMDDQADHDAVTFGYDDCGYVH